jgi:hypothetical protein
LGGPLGLATDADVEPESVTSNVHQVPLLRVADLWARGQYFEVAREAVWLNRHTVVTPTQ